MEVKTYKFHAPKPVEGPAAGESKPELVNQGWRSSSSRIVSACLPFDRVVDR